MMWPTVSPDGPLVSTWVGVPVAIGQRRERSVELPARDRHRRSAGIAGPSRWLCHRRRGRRDDAAIADSSDSWMR